MKVRLCRAENEEVVIDLKHVSRYHRCPQRGFLYIYSASGEMVSIIDKHLAEQYLVRLDRYFGTIDIADIRLFK